MPRATAITDASFCPRSKAGGWGAWININLDDGPRHIQTGGNFHRRPRNSAQAEMWAAYNGLFLAYRHGGRRIILQTDLMSLVEQRPPNYFKQREMYWPRAQVEWRHVKGHTGGVCPEGGDNRRFYANEWCDTEAKLHMREQRNERQGVRQGS